jgi:hypothetical protein
MLAMQTKQRLLWASTVTVICLLAATWSYTAPPVRDKVLQEVDLIQHDAEVVIEVQFSFPMRYRSHFPADHGEELRIRLQPVRVPSSDLDAVPRRESVIPQYAGAASVDEVIYEGDIEGGPYLTVRFTRPVSYQVIPGSDYRSMRVIVQSLD